MIKRIPKKEITADSIIFGFVCGIIATAFDSFVLKNNLDESLNCGIAVFAGTTAFATTTSLLSPRYRHIDDGTETDN